MFFRTMRFGAIAGSAMALLASTSLSLAQDASQNNKSWSAYVVSSSDGRMQSSDNVRDVTRTSTGVYRVDFKQGIGGCARIATVSSNDRGNGGNGGTMFGLISVSNSGGNGRHGGNDSGLNGGGGNGSNSLRVYTFNSVTGTATDLPFDLYVTCSGNGGNGD